MVKAEIRGKIGLVTLSRPWAENRLNGYMVREMMKELTKWEHDQGVKIILFTAEGDSFCTGFEWSEEERKKSKLEDLVEEIKGLFQRLYSHPKLTVALINGKTKALGLELAAACDFRLACPEARLSFEPFEDHIFPFISYHYVFKRMGPTRALELLGTSAELNGAEGYQARFVDHLLPGNELVEEALEWCHRFTRQPLEALMHYKKQAFKF